MADSDIPGSSAPKATQLVYCGSACRLLLGRPRTGVLAVARPDVGRLPLDTVSQSARGRPSTASSTLSCPSARPGSRTSTRRSTTNTTLTVRSPGPLARLGARCLTLTLSLRRLRVSDGADALKNKMGTLSLDKEKKLEADVEKAEKKAERKAAKEEESKKSLKVRPSYRAVSAPWLSS